METPPTTTPTEPPPPSSSDPPPTAPDPPSTAASTEPPPQPTSQPPPALSQNPPQTLTQEQQQTQPPAQQQRPPPLPRNRPQTQSIQRGGMAIGVPANYPHQQRAQSPVPFSSFRPSHPFNAPSPSFSQPFSGMPRSSAGGPEQSTASNAQVRQPLPGVQTIGMIGSLSTAANNSQMRPSGVSGQHQQRLGQPTVRSASPSTSQIVGSQKFQSLGVPRASSMTSPSSPSPAPQSSQSLQQQWMSAQGKQTHAASLPSSSYRPQMKQQIMQQRPQHPQQQQQHQLPMTSHQLQISSSQQQQQQQKQHHQLQQQQPPGSVPNQSQEHHLPPRNQPSLPQQQHQAARAFVSTTPKSSIQALAQPGVVTPIDFNDADEYCNEIISRRRVRELVTQIDRSEKLRPEIEDDLLEIADDFIESITTAACHLAKHRKSTALEAKDILLHVERHWNMTLPGFGGDEIKCYKKPSTNDIHKERLAMIKKSMAGTSDGGSAKNPSSAAGQTAANPKVHAAKAPAIGSPKAREPP